MTKTFRTVMGRRAWEWNSYAVWPAAQYPPARVQELLSDAVLCPRRRPFGVLAPQRRNLFPRLLLPRLCAPRLLSLTVLLTLGVFAALSPMSAQAKAAPTTASDTIVPRLQSQAFALGYALRLSDLWALDYTQSVKSLQAIDSPQVAGAEIAHLSRETPSLRHAQAAAYAQVSQLLSQMNAPDTLRQWAAQSTATLSAPLALSDEAKTLAKTEPDSAVVLAELDEIRAIKAAADTQQTTLSLWLKVTGSKVIPWTADVGSYAADLHHAVSTAGAARLPAGTARALLQRAPSESPTAVRESLAALVPSGGGNLQTLATITPSTVSPETLAHVYAALLAAYGAETAAEALDKNNT